MTRESAEYEGEVCHPDLDAWRVSKADGEVDRIIVGEWFHGPERIEIDPDDLVRDPDAYREES